MWQITLHQKAQQKLKIEGILKREIHYKDQIFFLNLLRVSLDQVASSLP
jgi:hypothetical protein